MFYEIDVITHVFKIDDYHVVIYCDLLARRLVDFTMLCTLHSLSNYHLSSRPDFIRRVATSGIRSNWQFTVTDQVNLHRLETFSGDVVLVVRVSIAQLT